MDVSGDGPASVHLRPKQRQKRGCQEVLASGEPEENQVMTSSEPDKRRRQFQALPSTPFDACPMWNYCPSRHVTGRICQRNQLSDKTCQRQRRGHQLHPRSGRRHLRRQQALLNLALLQLRGRRASASSLQTYHPADPGTTKES